MLFDISHTTRYRYDSPVFLEPHVLRFRPRCNAAQRVAAFHLETHPHPAGWSEMVDLDGNAVARAWFTGVTTFFTVVSTCKVESRPFSPFDFLLETGARAVPIAYEAALGAALAPYLARTRPSDAVLRFARAVLRDVGGETVPFLTTLTLRIAEECRQTVRLEGGPLPPEVTLQERTGSSRDLAVLFMDACRAVGVAARFVSGHQANDLQRREYLHAWAEVYLPGAGWRGFDPTQGLAVADRHVAVAAAAVPAAAGPISGTLRGTGASASMQVDLALEVAGAAGRQSQSVSAWAAVDP
jgi:transglutaminase-like putative cysteine protease